MYPKPSYRPLRHNSNRYCLKGDEKCSYIKLDQAGNKARGIGAVHVHCGEVQDLTLRVIIVHPHRLLVFGQVCGKTSIPPSVGGVHF